jgi:hypothetical protein
MLSDVHTKLYSVSGHLTVGKVTVLFKGRIIVKRCIAKEHKVFRKKIYTLCDMSGFVHKWMSIREGQDICNCRNDSNQSYCTHVARKLKGYGQELFINNFLFPTYSTI